MYIKWGKSECWMCGLNCSYPFLQFYSPCKESGSAGISGISAAFAVQFNSAKRSVRSIAIICLVWPGGKVLVNRRNDWTTVIKRMNENKLSVPVRYPLYIGIYVYACNNQQRVPSLLPWTTVPPVFCLLTWANWNCPGPNSTQMVIISN